MKKYLFATLALITITYFSAPEVFGQSLPCGNIIDQNGDSESIVDCADPFKVTIDPTNSYNLLVDGTAYNKNGDIVPVAEGGTNRIHIEGHPIQTNFRWSLFKHDGNDYRYVDLEEKYPTPEYFYAYIETYFTNDADRALYLNIVELDQNGEDYSAYLYNEDGSDKIDTTTGEAVSTRLQGFYMSADSDFDSSADKAGSGNYTMVITEYSIYSTSNTIWDRIRQHIIPTAHAQFIEDYRYTLTFSIIEAGDEPKGASSVLFLPGIMGSRLYEMGQQCGDFGEEQERWFSTTDCKQLRLLTGSAGDSLNDIYTKEGPSSVIDETLGFNLYKTFFSSLADWKEEGTIKDYALVPYDWRMRLDQILKTEKDVSGKIKYNPSIDVPESYLYKKIEELAVSSKTGKVTIVAHSNGGLVAKTFLATLQSSNDPLLEKIDTVILVASPQLGTPSTLLGMLHGDEIGPYGTIVSQLTTRRLLNTMPMAFQLLPNDSYFNSAGVTVDTPVIQFEAGSFTTPWINTFGGSIDEVSDLKNFLTTDSGRTKPALSDLGNPEVVPKYLFDNYTVSIDQLMNTWAPPASMKVYQIAGFGVPTQSGLTYFTDRECIARDILKLFKCTAYKDKLGVRPNDVTDGDATVVAASALAMSESSSNVQRWWLNLKSYNNVNFDRVHKDIFEVQDIINFIKNILEATTTAPYLYLTSTMPALPGEDRLIFDLHSPLDLSIVTNNGVISSSSVTIDGAIYKRFGEMQHISMPNITDKKTVVLAGEGTGSFTLEIGEQEGNVVTRRHTYSAIPSSTSTKVIMELESAKPIEQSLLVVDYDGNGTPEITYNTVGEVVPEVTYGTLKNTITNLNIKSLYKKLLLENVKIAEQYQIKSLTQIKYKKLELLALNVLKQQVILYEGLKVLTPSQTQELLVIIDKLLIK